MAGIGSETNANGSKRVDSGVITTIIMYGVVLTCGPGFPHTKLGPRLASKQSSGFRATRRTESEQQLAQPRTGKALLLPKGQPKEASLSSPPIPPSHSSTSYTHLTAHCPLPTAHCPLSARLAPLVPHLPFGRGAFAWLRWRKGGSGSRRYPHSAWLVDDSDRSSCLRSQLTAQSWSRARCDRFWCSFRNGP